MYKVSVIMPIYNAEKYLNNTLDSVINQSMGFENIELILVDDCSTDNSRNIIEEYSKNYSNIKPIFLEENSGCPGIPRNVGIENATSDYIMFIDSDDLYFPEMCDKLYNAIIFEDADFVICDALVTDNYGGGHKSFDSDICVFGDEIIYCELNVVWNGIFKKSIILNNNIHFSDWKVSEDLLFTTMYSTYSQKLFYLKGFVGYHHFDRTSSISSNSMDWQVNTIKSYNVIFEFLESRNDGVKYDLNRFFKDLIRFNIFRAIIGDNNELKERLFLLCDFEKRINFNGDLPIFYKVINFFILHGNLNIATYICLFIARVRGSNLILKIYRKFVLKHD